MASTVHDPESAAAAAEEVENAVDAAAAGVEEEDTGAHIAPIVHLEQVAVTTGEEDEEVLLDHKAKLYRFDKDSNQWKERGTGSVKLLKHKESGKVRIVMRQSKTLKICANHFVTPAVKMQQHVGNEKSCVWQATDFADGELKAEMFCIRFASIENCKHFMESVEKFAGEETPVAAEKAENSEETETTGEVNHNEASSPASEVTNNKKETASEDASAAAGLLERLSVGESSPKEPSHEA